MKISFDQHRNTIYFEARHMSYELDNNGAVGEELVIDGIRPNDYALLARDFTNDGRRDLVLARYEFGDRTWEAPELHVATATGFAPTPIAITEARWRLFPNVLDVDGDGELDIIAAMADTGVFVHFGRGDGTFDTVSIVELPQVVSIDVDLESNELLVATSDPPQVQIYGMQGRENAVLVDTRELTQPIGYIYSADIDPFPPNDIFVEHALTAEATHGFLLRAASGRIQPEETIYAPACAGLVSSVDFDGDGYRDLVCRRGAVLRFDPRTHTMPAPQIVPLPFMRPTSLISLDINGDGSLDLASDDVGQLALLFGEDGVFAAPRVQNIEVRNSQIYAGDLDLDGLAELVTRGSGSLAVFKYESDSMSYQLVRGLITAVPDLPGVMRARIDDDQIDDLITSGELWIGNAAGSFSRPPLASKQSNDRRRCFGTCLAGVAALGDFDGDNFVDVASTSTSNPSMIDIYRGGADQSFTFAYSLAVNVMDFEQIVSLAVDDTDGDGDLDLVALDRRDLLVFENDGGQLVFEHEIRLIEEDQLTRAQVADINGDGRPDLLASSEINPDNGLRSTAAFGVLLGQEGGGFATARWFGVHNHDFDSALDDFDRDGRLDVAILNFEGPALFLTPNSVSIILQRP